MLTVLGVAYPFAPVQPDAIGGAEHVVMMLDSHLVRAGHAPILLASEGSRSAGWLVPIARRPGTIDDAAYHHAHEAYRRELARLLREHAIDVVHLHGSDFIEYVPDTDLPIVVTLHLPPGMYKPAALQRTGIHRVCVSHAQLRACPEGSSIDRVIPNGIPVHRYTPSASKSSFVLALGRLCPEKGFELAIRAAREARVPLVLGGALFPYEAHIRYVREELAPLLDTERRWVGPVTGATKRSLLAEASCLLVTSRVDETSSLVAMEALASGTPVVGFRRGALPELVEHGVTGWLVDHPEELPQAIYAASRLSSATCRAVARERACADRMTERYVALYRELAHAPLRRGASHSLVTHTIETDDELEAIADEWSALCERSPIVTPFQRPEWLLAWRRWFGAGATPRTIALRRGGRLVGLVPLEVRDRTLRLIGAGISDYLDAIVEPGIDPLPALREAAAGCAAIELEALRPCSPLRAATLGGRLHPAIPSPVVALATRKVPGRVASDLRRLARKGVVSWEDERGDRLALIEALFELHEARWGSCGQSGVLDTPQVRGFHREVVITLHERGVLRLVGLRLDERLIGVLYGFADHGRFMFYLSGFAPDLARFSPGRLMIAHAIERALDEAAIEFDFLRGREAYKYEWGAVDRPSSIYRARLEEDACSAFAGR